VDQQLQRIGSPAAVFDRGTNRRPELVERRCRLAVADGGGREVIGRHAVDALIRHDGHLKSNTLLDWEPVSFT